MENKKLVVGLIIFIIVIILLVGGVFVFVYFNQEKIPEDKKCIIDSDCVPKDCCHSVSCVHKSQMPNCHGILCTAVCSGILDCGQGECECIKDKCVAVPK